MKKLLIALYVVTIATAAASAYPQSFVPPPPNPPPPGGIGPSNIVTPPVFNALVLRVQSLEHRLAIAETRIGADEAALAAANAASVTLTNRVGVLEAAEASGP